jgi:predicted PurR-regulated permease PerM
MDHDFFVGRKVRRIVPRRKGVPKTLLKTICPFYFLLHKIYLMSKREESTYITKVWQTMGIVALLVSAILIARVAFNVLLMILAGSLIATYFHGLGDMIERRTKLKRKWAMLISVLSTFVIIGGLFWFMGTKIQQQVNQLSDSLPGTVHNLKAKLSQNDLGRKLLQSLDQSDDGNMMKTAQSFFPPASVYWVIFILFYFSEYFLPLIRPCTKTGS